MLLLLYRAIWCEILDNCNVATTLHAYMYIAIKMGMGMYIFFTWTYMHIIGYFDLRSEKNLLQQCKNKCCLQWTKKHQLSSPSAGAATYSTPPWSICLHVQCLTSSSIKQVLHIFYNQNAVDSEVGRRYTDRSKV